MQYLLDADTCIAAMRSHPRVLQRLAIAVPGDCAISTITRYEFWVGVEKSADPVKEKAKVDLLARSLRRVRFGVAAAEHAARVRVFLEALSPFSRGNREWFPPEIRCKPCSHPLSMQRIATNCHPLQRIATNYDRSRQKNVPGWEGGVPGMKKALSEPSQ